MATEFQDYTLRDAVERLNRDSVLTGMYHTHWKKCPRKGKDCHTCFTYIHSNHYTTNYLQREKDPTDMGHTPRSATSACPYEDSLVTMISVDTYRIVVYYKTKEEKINALLRWRRGDTLLVCWPGKVTQDIFQISNEEQREKALARLGLRPRPAKPAKTYTAANGTVYESTND